uniref:Ion transport domain-containing protein n=1 Tax=Acrobeloides nanus TaxID=290746 RepID=A0A914CLW2_9BILA
MVWYTIETFIRFSPIFILFLLPFSVTFHVLLGDQPGFFNLMKRVLHTIVFLTGEFDYGDNIKDNSFATTYFVFLLYLFVGTVFLMNLLIGLAVSDTNVAMEKAMKTRLGLEVDIILHVESYYPQFLHRVMARGKMNKTSKLDHVWKRIFYWFGLPKDVAKQKQLSNE